MIGHSLAQVANIVLGCAVLYVISLIWGSDGVEYTFMPVVVVSCLLAGAIQDIYRSMIYLRRI
jgi:hypothetical protein